MIQSSSNEFVQETTKSDVISTLEGKKKLQSQVHYRPQTSDTYELCSECEYYENPDQPQSPCRKVVGFVSANGTCDLFIQRITRAPTGSTVITIQIGK